MSNIYKELEDILDRLVEDSRKYSVLALNENFVELAVGYNDRIRAREMFDDEEIKRFILIQDGYKVLENLEKFLINLKGLESK